MLLPLADAMCCRIDSVLRLSNTLTRETRLPQAGTLRIVMDMSTDHRQPS